MAVEIPEIPPASLAIIDKPQYEEEGQFPIEMGYVWNTCAAVRNGNPLYWDEKVAEEITGGQVAPQPCCRCGSGSITGRRASRVTTNP